MRRMGGTKEDYIAVLAEQEEYLKELRSRKEQDGWVKAMIASTAQAIVDFKKAMQNLPA